MVERCTSLRIVLDVSEGLDIFTWDTQDPIQTSYLVDDLAGE